MAEAARREKERKLRVIITRQETLFRRLQILYDLQTELEDESKISQFKVRFAKLEETRHAFEASVQEINSLNVELDAEYSCTEQSLLSFDDMYYEIQATAARLEASTVTGDALAIRSPSAQTTQGRARLPKIELVKFDGTLSQWQTFYDVFCSLIHNDATIHPIQKFHYLITTLSGPPLSIVKGLPITEANYSIVWAMLVEEYQNERNLANSLLEKLFSARPLPTEAPSSLSLYVQQFQEQVQALQLLNINLADYMLVYLGLRNLDADTRKQFEMQCEKSKIPTLAQFLEFLKNYVGVLQRSQVVKAKSKSHVTNSSVNLHSKPPRVLISTSNTAIVSCILCKQQHRLMHCPQFLSLTPLQRRAKCKEGSFCFNCLASSHRVDKCNSKYTCRECNKRHHTLLHTDSTLTNRSTSPNSTPSTSSRQKELYAESTAVNSLDTAHHPPPHSLTCSSPRSSSTTVLLGTVQAKIQDRSGYYHNLRLVIDCGSQLSFITAQLVDRLNLPRRKCYVPVSGIGSLDVPLSKGVSTCVITPSNHDYPQLCTEAVILPKISANLPVVPLSPAIRESFGNLHLADPNFDKPGPIDMLLGADLYPSILLDGRLMPTSGHPTAINTIFGWIIMGKVETSSPRVASTAALLTYTNSLEETVKRFWEVEEPCCPATKNPEDNLVESHFLRTHSRSSSGQYVVAYPFRDKESLVFGDMNQAVLKRLFSLEHRLSKQPKIKADYTHFMQEYHDLGHMQVAHNPGSYLIPHHCVLTPSNTTTKLRVVFDASFAACSNASLNQQLYVGPKLQTDISNIINNFRQYPVAITADICKMYRQIWIQPEDRQYQHIYWRSSHNKPIQEYELNTVTYGIASAPFLAIRVLHQLVSDEGAPFPRASQALLAETYVDNIVSGANSVAETLTLQSQLTHLLKLGGFTLRKWASNSPQVLNDIPEAERESLLSLDDSTNPSMKLLGIQWDPSSDSFCYHISDIKPVFTKRGVLSMTARIFDPLGWAAPSILWAKVFFQDLWLSGLQWDDQLPTKLRTAWWQFVQQVPLMRHLKIPRNLNTSMHLQNQIIGFCDASERGYSAVVYLRTVDSQGDITISLIMAKTKVAPIKPLTIPKLELCGALLLARVLDSVQPLIQTLNVQETFLFTDSSIVCTWLHTPLHLLKIYVSNRVTQILEITRPSEWQHIASELNPADCASRGLLPSELLNDPLWWNGPSFLQQPEKEWPVPLTLTLQMADLPELKPIPPGKVTLVGTTLDSDLIPWMERFSSLLSLQRVMCYVLRFINKARNTIKVTGPPSASEMKKALEYCIKLTQEYFYKTDLEKLKTNSSASPRLASLAPFLDPQGICRVGGRIRHSALPYDTKHPIIIPKKSYLATLLVDYFHNSYLHVGPRTLQSILQRQYWIPGARSLIRSRIFKCLTCYKRRAKPLSPHMGDLPSARVTPSRPFLHCGMDFGGPILLRESLRRKAATYKAYFCIFCCLATKAVHLEVVTSLSTEAFLAALRRFISRRGLCTDLYSDNGTNFIGAARHLRELYAFINTSTNQENLNAKLAPEGITWHFNPPSSPHFGGLWEAGIKSTKYHLHRLVKDHPFTYEEFYTILTRIEAILNSRPLSPLSSDPSEMDTLTPGHFLVGSSILQVPESSLLDVPDNRLTRWQLTQKIAQHFWTRWSQEYLATLQGRIKWTKGCQNLKSGDLVLLMEEQYPTGQWILMGRVEEVYPGKDGIIRVVTIRTKKGLLKRPVHKLVAFPFPQ